MPRCGHTRTYRARVPNQPKTRKHGLRFPDDVWDAAMKRAHGDGKTLTSVLLRFLIRYGRGMEDDY